ncbi:MAG TPA: pyridoxamine 5'-phosphate oxidase family protein [Mucilaginibacter sp.]|jgi:hypothetical protein
MGYESLAFSKASKILQEAYGSRKAYNYVEETAENDRLTVSVASFIEDRDSFYLATIGESGYPYVQYKGGPKGFLKVLDAKTIGMIDFSGNKQYITAGNINTNNKVSLFLVDYPQQARLKLFADVRILEINEEPELFTILQLPDYKYKAERILIFDIKGFNWNCSQHITPRYTVEEIAAVSDQFRNFNS